MKINPQTRAFTLVEVLIAMGLFTMVMGSVYACWSSVLRGTRIGLAAAANAQRGRVALHTVEQALITCQLFNDNNRYYTFLTESGDPYCGVQMTSRLPDSFLGSGYFGKASLRRVLFTVERGDYNENNLILTQVPMLDASEAQDPYKIVLARDVTLFSLEYWRPGDKDFTPDFLYTNQLPKLVRVTLGLGHDSRNYSKPSQLMVRLVHVPSEVVMTRF
jgi:prepilin-type N-terminal cleavage/methylation domain-containing protein